MVAGNSITRRSCRFFLSQLMTLVVDSYEEMAFMGR
jgi:hypothetical protein